MFIEQPPIAYRLLFPEAIWRLKKHSDKAVFLTFDDGPIPEVTPWVLDTLDRYGIKATFFMVGDNVARHPELYEEVLRRGHAVGNHTMHHLQGMHTSTYRYMHDISEANHLIKSSLFRPPHGLIKWKQARAIRDRYNIVMYDLVTRDYSKKMTPEKVFNNVRRYARNGSIIVFHDSLKAERNMKEALPKSIEWLLARGYTFERLGNP